jgi:hypothetical protein
MDARAKVIHNWQALLLQLLLQRSIPGPALCRPMVMAYTANCKLQKYGLPTCGQQL